MSASLRASNEKYANRFHTLSQPLQPDGAHFSGTAQAVHEPASFT